MKVSKKNTMRYSQSVRGICQLRMKAVGFSYIFPHDHCMNTASIILEPHERELAAGPSLCSEGP